MNKLFVKKFCTKSESISTSSIKNSKNLTVTGKVVYFLAGTGLTLVFLYTNYMNQVKKRDALLKSEIEDYKKLADKKI